MIRVLKFYFALALAAVCASGLDVSKLAYTGYVNDFANVLDARGKAAIEAYCENLDRRTGVQFAVVMVPSLEGDSIDDTANRLYERWGIGKSATDEGLLFLLAIQDRKQRVELGYGLEPVISDGTTGEVLRGIRPILRQGDYAGAVLAALQTFGARVATSKGVDLGTGESRPRRGAEEGIPWPVILFFLFFVLMMLGSRGGGGGRRGRGMDGFLPGLILGSLGQGRRGGYGGWSGGGFGGYDSGGGGGFGGFGGGSAGGGGASSDW